MAMSRSYYTRKNQRRATTGGAIDENWEELVPPEYTIATSTPAIDTVAGGRIGAHFGRIGLARGHAVPHGLPSANALLQGQMSRRTTFTSYIPGSPSNWPWLVGGENREHGKTLSALAVANSVATVIPFAPNPGSPPTKPRSALGRINWLGILPEAPPDSTHDPTGDWKSDTSSDSNPSLFSPRDIDTPATEALPSPKASHVPPALILAPPPRIPLPRRSVPLPRPAHGVLEPRESTQVLILEPRAQLFDSPVPLTSSTIATSHQPPLNSSVHAAQTIIDGLSDLFDFAERQETIDQYSATGSSIDPYLHPWRRDQNFPTSVHASASAEDWVVCTPTTPSTYRTADSRERKLLIIGSSYETNAYRQASLNASLKGVSFDAKSLSSVFRRRRYAVESLMGDTFDARTVLDRITDFLSDAEAGDVRAIIFTGHANQIGSDKKVAIAPPINEHPDNPQAGWITSDQWEETVRQGTKPGVIVLSIFASCFSGGFMQQRVSIRDLSDPTTRNPTASSAPIFITFASCKEDQRAYDSIVGCPCETRGPWRDSVWRYGDHFLRAFTLAARESNLSDWRSFVKVLDEKLKEVRKIGAIFAEDSTWPENHPQEAVYTVSRNTIPGWEDIMPDDASMIEAPTPNLTTSTIDLSEAFLAHIALCGENPEITHFTSADAQ